MSLFPYICTSKSIRPSQKEFMINRELIRLKTVQLVYAYYLNEDRKTDVAEKELYFSLSKAYDMYRLLLLLMVEITEWAGRRVESEKERAQRLNLPDTVNTKFVDNKFIAQLAVNKQLLAFDEKRERRWTDEDALMRGLLNKILESDIYNIYMATPASTYAEDRELWRRLYKTFICENEDLDGVFEEQSLYWNDDKIIVDSFVLKTIKRFDEENGADQPLLPEYDNEEDREFAGKLFRSTIENAEYYRQLIRDTSRNWEFNRLAYMDVIIMQIALAEIVHFPSIPLNVSFNEYLDIAKLYSTPKSASYINGLLDHVVQVLRKENIVMKSR